MLALVQRVRRAQVDVAGQTVGRIAQGLLVLLCAEQGDTPAQGDKLLAKLLKLRIFSDADGKMNRSVQDLDGAGLHGGLLIVSQFTLAADTATGTRPGFSTAASPELATALFAQLLAAARAAHPVVASGEFGAHMQVSLTNDGPVTFWLQASPKA